ncbi:MAG: MTH1187 family thiamine-binding protein [Desulfovibrionaceae bacterium]
MSCVVQFAIFPLDKGDAPSLAPYVARALEIVRASGLPYALGPMGTVLEGEYHEIMAVIGRCHDELRADCARVYLTVAVDSKAEGSERMTGKVRSVEALL